MSAIDIAVARLKTEEGFRATKYTDMFGNETIGYGFNISAGITRFCAAALLAAQTQEIAQTLSTLPWYQRIDDARASVFLDIAINDGLRGLLGFPSMLHYTALRDWPNASAQLLDSKAARELPTRYTPLAQLLLNGQ